MGKQCSLGNIALGKHLLNNHIGWYTFFCRKGGVVQFWHFVKNSTLLDFFLLSSSILNYSDVSSKSRAKYESGCTLGLRAAVRGDLGVFYSYCWSRYFRDFWSMAIHVMYSPYPDPSFIFEILSRASWNHTTTYECFLCSLHLTLISL